MTDSWNRTLPRRNRELPTVNLTPLIDVLFIVLLFLVLTTRFDDSFALDVSLPDAESADLVSSDGEGVIRIVVQANGRLLLDGQVVTLSEVAQVLVDAAQAPAVTLLIAADAHAAHGAVVTVLDRARQAGISSLRLETTSPDRND